MRTGTRKLWQALGLAAASLLAGACGVDELDVEVSFVPGWQGQPVACDSVLEDFVGRRLADLRFYVSRPRMLQSEGGERPIRLTADGIWQSDDVALIDLGGLCNGGGNAVLRGKVVAQSFTGLTFDVGVPFAANHANPLTAQAPLNVGEMFWSWQLGHKFLRVDFLGSEADAGWSLHLGSTGCESDSSLRPPVSRCRQPNVVAVVLPSLAPERLQIQVDLGALASAGIPAGTPSCMGDFAARAACRETLAALGLDAVSGEPCAAEACGSQRVFRSR